YLLAMVIAYFSRAGLPSGQYQRIHFFLALYLAMTWRRTTRPQRNIFYFLYGKTRLTYLAPAWVSPEELEEIQAYDPEHWVWTRDRARLS
ncbi:SPDYE1 isoform 1, partial [Pongo abelii]